MKQNNSILRIIPNFLTLFRSLAAIVLPLIIIYGGEIGALIAIPMLFLAGISDYFDGFFARKYNVTSNFGKILDPIADKLLVIGVIFALASENMLDYYYAFIPALLIVLREILVSGLRESISSYKISLEVTPLAKWKTTIQLIACGSFLVWRSNTFFYSIDILGLISYILFWMAGIVTFITGLQYIIKIVKFFDIEINRE
jgi:cardiolipin synthase